MAVAVFTQKRLGVKVSICLALRRVFLRADGEVAIVS
jgi:hypothetical protein